MGPLHPRAPRGRDRVSREAQAEKQLQMLLGVTVLKFTALSRSLPKPTDTENINKREKNAEKCNTENSSEFKY